MKSSDSTGKRGIVLTALDEYEKRLVRYVTRLLNSDSDQARDIVQDAFMKLCEQDVAKIEQRIGPWLYAVCRNRVFDESKRKTPDQMSDGELQIVSHESDPAAVASQQEFTDLIRELIASLPGAQREAIDLWADGLSHREIGEVTGRKPPAVRALIHRAKQNIKSHPAVVRWTDVSESKIDSATDPALR